MIRFAVGATVLRREVRPERRAVVVEIVDDVDGPTCRLAYAEGGEGWWPQSELDPDDGEA